MADNQPSAGSQTAPRDRDPAPKTAGDKTPAPPAPTEPRKPWRVEGMPPAGDGAPRQPHWKELVRRIWLPLLVLLLVNWVFALWVLGPTQRTTISYTFFREQVDADNVVDVTTSGDSITGTFRNDASYTKPGEKPTPVKDFKTARPSFADDGLVPLLLQHKVTVNAKPPATTPWWQQLLVGFGPTLLLIGLYVMFIRRAGAAGLGGFGRSRARLYEPEKGPRTTFADVAGIDEVKAEVVEIVDFLKDPAKYRHVGASIPHGVLLTGAPGTGKTLLARAVAGEAEVPFFSVSAAEFIEMIVGVGASRVRDLFGEAKKAAPSIIFIDELDAIGRSRSNSAFGGGHDEQEQTLNQILTEMDGFTGTEGVVVLAATNRPEILDSALLRPGRFDRRIAVNPPDQTGRRQILAVHTRKVRLAPSVSLDAIAASTPGMVGADLKNLVNEAALLAVRRNHGEVEMADFSDAIERIVLGTERHIMLSVEDKRRTAVHESGHALLGMLTPGADPVRKVSIIPRGQSLGATFQSPQADRYGYSSTYLRGRIVGALGGRAAEDLVYGDITTGAESDLEMVTSIARQMVGRWGMSPRIGPVIVISNNPQEQFSFDGNGPSAATREVLDAEVRRIVDECYDQALDTLRTHRDSLDQLAQRLLEAETLDEQEAYDAAGIDHATAEEISPRA